jgi:type VI secretion system protein ImpJ
MAQINTYPIQWHEGMLMMPQHFQESDTRLENLVTYFVSHAVPFFWGTINIKVDDALLTSGVFRPLELEAIMPDGLLISGLPESETPLQIDLEPFRDKLQSTPLYIYLCVPQQRGADLDIVGDLPRYQSTLSKNVVDMNTGDRAIDIPRLSPNLSLQVSDTPPAHYVCLPLAQVTCNAKSYSQTNYIPPQLQVPTTSSLGDLCNQLTFRLRQKLAYLQQKVQSVEKRATRDPFFEEIEEIRLKLIAGLIPFETVLSIGKAHPFSIYLELCSLAGLISGVKYGEIPPPFDAYDHDDLNQTFKQVIVYIDKVLSEIEESYTVIPFILTERVFTLQLQSSWVSDRLVLGARAQPSMSESDLLAWIKNCVIVTSEFIGLAKDNRVLGVPRKIVSEIPEMNLVPSRGVQLFVIDVNPQYIDPKGVLCLFNVSDNELNRPTEIVLYNSNKASPRKGS